ncbi:MAG: hypothetical protein V4622_12595 [Bacteroidota bacterium]
MIRILFFTTFLSLFSTFSFSQIVSGKKTQKPKRDLSSNTNDTLKKAYLLLSYNNGISFREMSITEKIVKKQEQLNAETKMPVSNFELSFKSEINKHFYYHIGIGTQKYGEKYDFVGDTSISYTTTYSNLAIPLKLSVQTGTKLNLFASTGIQAQMLVKYRKYETTIIGNNETEVIYKKSTNISPFTLASTSSIGVQYNLDIVSFSLAGEYIRQLTSTFDSQKGIVHKPYFYGVKLSIGFRI